MEDGNNINNTLKKSMELDRRRAYKYIRNMVIGILVMGVVVIGTVSVIRSANTMVTDYGAVSGTRG